MALSTFQQQPKQLCYIQTQTSSTTIPSTTINKNTINNPKVNKQQCYYYHNTDNIDEQMSQKCVPCKSMSILPDNFITMDRTFIHQGRIRSWWSITLKPIQIWATTQEAASFWIQSSDQIQRILCLLKSSNLPLPIYDEKRTLYCNNLGSQQKKALNKIIIGRFCNP